MIIRLTKNTHNFTRIACKCTEHYLIPILACPPLNTERFNCRCFLPALVNTSLRRIYILKQILVQINDFVKAAFLSLGTERSLITNITYMEGSFAQDCGKDLLRSKA
jgi:hypothetical protein